MQVIVTEMLDVEMIVGSPHTGEVKRHKQTPSTANDGRKTKRIDDWRAVCPADLVMRMHLMPNKSLAASTVKSATTIICTRCQPTINELQSLRRQLHYKVPMGL